MSKNVETWRSQKLERDQLEPALDVALEADRLADEAMQAEGVDERERFHLNKAKQIATRELLELQERDSVLIDELEALRSDVEQNLNEQLKIPNLRWMQAKSYLQIVAPELGQSVSDLEQALGGFLGDAAQVERDIAESELDVNAKYAAFLTAVSDRLEQLVTESSSVKPSAPHVAETSSPKRSGRRASS